MRPLPNPTLPRWLLAGLATISLTTLLPAQEPTATRDVVFLPPFIVDDGPRNKVWYYVEAPSFRILAAGSDIVALQFARSYHRQEALLRRLIPEKYLWKSSLPELHLLMDNAGDTRLSDDALGGFFDQQRREAFDKGRDLHVMPNLRLTDQDRIVVFATHDHENRQDVNFRQGMQIEVSALADGRQAARDRLD